MSKNLALKVGKLLLPKEGTDYFKWATIACDQFTSQPEYWKRVEATVGDAPSTLRIVFPEVYLEEGPDAKKARIQSINQTMKDYVKDGLFEETEGFVYLERSCPDPHTGKDRKRHGLMGLLDLEAYDYSASSTTLIRATEGTIVDRIPPRKAIRGDAIIELPHILVLIDDPEGGVIGSLTDRKKEFKQMYDTDLMEGSGHVTGWMVDKDGEKAVFDALSTLADPAVHGKKYGMPEDTPVLLFAMGDGNHSLATAKSIWEDAKAAAKDKEALLKDSKLRYALVEINNIHDSGLEFEAIHRVLFGVKKEVNLWTELETRLKATRAPVKDLAELNKGIGVAEVDGTTVHKFGMVDAQGMHVVTAPAVHNLPVGTLMTAMDPLVKEEKCCESIDYVHGDAVTATQGAKASNAGFILPSIEKSDLFKTVLVNGALPRKTFSMGEAEEKRFYMECRLLE